MLGPGGGGVGLSRAAEDVYARTLVPGCMSWNGVEAGAHGWNATGPVAAAAVAVESAVGSAVGVVVDGVG